MKILNPFKLQNWEYKKFLIVILGIQLSLLGLFGLNKLGVETPILRAFIGFIYVSFVPGYLILRILKLNKLDSLESFVYSLGLSIFFLMLVGFLINILFPYLKITDYPISETPVILSLSGFTVLLLIISYFNNLKNTSQEYLNIKTVLNPQFLFLSLIPFMAIFGTYLVNYFHTNLMILLMFLIISITILGIGFTGIINKKYYPIILFLLAVSLVFHIVLIGQYVNNHDGELTGAKETLNQNYWDYLKYGNYASILSNNLLAPIVALVCNLGIVYIYKIIFPIWISAFPVIIYKISLKHLSEKESFLGVMLILSSTAFINIFTVITKQFMAELFISLSILGIISKISQFEKKIILTIFSIGIIWSHYGTSYLYLLGLIFVFLILKLYNIIVKDNNIENLKIIFFWIKIYILIILSWYFFASGSSLYIAVLSIGKSMYISIINGAIDEGSRGVTYLTEKSFDYLSLTIKVMNILPIFMITLGITDKIHNFRNLNINICYLSISVYFLGLLFATLLPKFAVMGPERIYLLSLITLSTFFVFGVTSLSKLLCNNKKDSVLKKVVLKLTFCYLLLLMLLNYGVIQEITLKQPNSIALSENSVDKYSSFSNMAKYYGKKIMACDIYSIKWLSKTHIYDTIGYTKGRYSVSMIPKNYGYIYDNDYKLNVNLEIKKSYIWLMYANVVKHIGFGSNLNAGLASQYNFSDLESQIYENCKIYDNGQSQILIT
ncbi:putative membrane protein [Methanococcus maripaludis]|uniref:Putative membrane protein n=1 Tax=Methanococcus maripaludis TaxID=39152 RepID=A0A7J9NIL9_METMI|nr:DUF2206 domain-containing protein [Methanococcus maripaludis]MBA2840766.1 putative membrane protein [Methanococcus maripaludis]